VPEKVSPWGFAGMAALACLLFLDLASLLISPWWAVVVLVLVWLVLFARACRWFTPAPRRVAKAAIAGYLLWLVIEVVGGLWVW
jgi:hypothetical protein